MSTFSFIRMMAAFLILLGNASAADWPQYRGPKGDGISTETVSKKWPQKRPPALWKIPTTDGFSSFSISQGRVFTLLNREVDEVKREACVAFNAALGKQLWEVPLDIAKYDGGGESGEPSNQGGDGPRSTPATDGSSVYVLTANLNLYCLEAKNGNTRWSKNLLREHGGENIRWKNAASPILEGDLVIVAGGGSGQALLGISKKDGKVIWKGENDLITHATPVAATIAEVRQVIFFTQNGLVAVAPADGKVLWRYKFPFNVSTAASPVVGEDIVYCSAGYDVGSAAVKISKQGAGWAAQELWRLKGNKPVANHWSTPVYKEGHLYGMFSFKEYGNGPLKCVELATGKVKWEQKGFGAGNVILAGNDLLALTDRGEMVLVEAQPASYKEIARADLLDGKCWSSPALSDGRLYLRSTKEGGCFDLSATP